jgi:hypothetical protein
MLRGHQCHQPPRWPLPPWLGALVSAAFGSGSIRDITSRWHEIVLYIPAAVTSQSFGGEIHPSVQIKPPLDHHNKQRDRNLSPVEKRRPTAGGGRRRDYQYSLQRSHVRSRTLSPIDRSRKRLGAFKMNYDNSYNEEEEATRMVSLARIYPLEKLLVLQPSATHHWKALDE